jgi:hypothetical protein
MRFDCGGFFLVEVVKLDQQGPLRSRTNNDAASGLFPFSERGVMTVVRSYRGRVVIGRGEAYLDGENRPR